MSSRELHDVVHLVSDNLGEGESIRIICPECGGGSTTERSLSITKRGPGTSVFRCFRAKCGVTGSVLHKGGSVRAKERPEERRSSLGSTFTYDLVDLTSHELSFFEERFPGITRDSIITQRWQWSEELKRVIMPIYALDGTMLGYNARNYKELSGADSDRKVIAYWFKESGHYHKVHYPLGTVVEDRLVLVEDMVSALKLSSIVPTAALLGSHMSIAQSIGIKMDIPEGCKVFLALDGDATDKALKIKEKNKLLFGGNFLVIPLSNKDPKDILMEELREMFPAVGNYSASK